MTGTSEATVPHEAQEDWAWWPADSDNCRNGFSTKEEAIEAARAYVLGVNEPDGFIAKSQNIFVGPTVTAEPDFVIPDGDDILEHMQDQAEGNTDEGGMFLASEMGWLDGVTNEQRDELTKAVRPIIRKWLEDHGRMPTWWHVSDHETVWIEAPPDPAEEQIRQAIHETMGTDLPDGDLYHFPAKLIASRAREARPLEGISDERVKAVAEKMKREQAGQLGT